MENLREAGYRVPKKYLPLVRSQEEKDDWKRQKWLEALEQARTNRPEQEYFGQEEDDMADLPKKEMRFADPRVSDVVFTTKVNIKQVRSRTTGRWTTIITLGKDQDKVFLVASRKDGQGVTLMTDWTDYMVPEVDPPAAAKEVVKV
jgi:hypothetical protein